MILADKIILQRKKNGWSQEELAERLNVSRQSVSKWEGAQSVPDMQRILEMSRLFGVSTDYLLKDELEAESGTVPQDAESDPPMRRVSMEDAQKFIALRHREAKKLALGVFLILLGVALLVLSAGSAECGMLPVGENAGTALGVIVLLICIAAAGSLFIVYGQRLKPFEYLEKEIFDTEYGVTGMVRERRAADEKQYRMYPAVGVALCICAAIPLLLTALLNVGEFAEICAGCILLVMVGAAVVLFIIYGINKGSTDILMQDGDYTATKKKKDPIIGTVSGIYWLIAVAAFLAWSFITDAWDRTWILWPVAGVLFPAVIAVTELLVKDKTDN